MMALGCHFNDEPLSRFWDYFRNSAVYTLTMKDDELTLVPGLEE